MLGSLRRSRLLSLALLLVTPGVAGTLLQAAHPCPAQAPGLSPSGGASNAHHHGGHGSDPGVPPDCHCIGACHAASTWAPPAAGPVVALDAIGRIGFERPLEAAVAPAALPYRFLPPATAPPLG